MIDKAFKHIKEAKCYEDVGGIFKNIQIYFEDWYATSIIGSHNAPIRSYFKNGDCIFDYSYWNPKFTGHPHWESYPVKPRGIFQFRIITNSNEKVGQIKKDLEEIIGNFTETDKRFTEISIS